MTQHLLRALFSLRCRVRFRVAIGFYIRFRVRIRERYSVKFRAEDIYHIYDYFEESTAEQLSSLQMSWNPERHNVNPRPEVHTDMILFEVFLKNIHLIPQDHIVQ